MTILIVEGTAKIYRKAGNIAVIDKDSNGIEVSLPDLELIVAVGERIHITSSAIITAISQGVPIVFISGRTDSYGILYDVVQVGTVNIREAQYRCFTDSYCRTKYAKPIIYSKIKGLYNVLKYEYKYHKEVTQDIYDYIKYNMLEVLEEIKNVNNVEELRLLEAKGSKYFWDAITNFIPSKYEFTGRKPRKGDPINSAIDFLYAIVYGITTKALVSNGLDPYYGLIHTLKSGRLSLTYDLSEILKPIAIHVIIQASRKVNIRTFKSSRLLKPGTIKSLVKYLYRKLSRESERMYKRKSIWQIPIREANKLKNSVLRQVRYEPYTYNPTT